MEKLKRFFWLCSGVNIPLLERCPTEASKYVGIGATIFFTGVFAWLAAGYALFTVFDSYFLAGLLGLIWGLMIFNLDRYIVSSMRKEGRRDWVTALPRLVLAVIISLVIAKPLEMKIFDKEISGELTIMEQQTRSAQENEIRSRYTADRTRLTQDIATLKQEIVTKTLTRDALLEEARAEADGTGGTMKRNAGPIYKLKKADADRVDEELKALTELNLQLIADKNAQLATTDSTLQAEIASLEAQKLDGPAARMEALSRLTENSSAIWLANWFVILLFIAVETAPVFVKLISPVGPYDHLLKIEEHGFAGQRIELIAKENAEIKARTSTLPNTEKTFVDERLDIKLHQS